MRLAKKHPQGVPPGNPSLTDTRPGVVQTHALHPPVAYEYNGPDASMPFYPIAPAVEDPYHQALAPSYGYDNIRHEEHPQQHSLHPPPAKPVERNAPRPSKSSSSEASGPKPKLPHGLTVHELKEMTKARLRAEASEKRTSPETLVPSVVRASPEYRDAHAPSPTLMASPPPYRNTRSPYPEARSPLPAPCYPMENVSHDSRNEWESGSVSTQTSDYVAPELAFASFNEDYHRAASFPNPPPRDIASPSQFAPSPGQFVPNRRRAATLSPRVGLSHLHEDRPFAPVGLPSYPRPVVTMGTASEDNRSRTLSAVSLPAMSHTAEEFAEPPRLHGSRMVLVPNCWTANA